MKDPKSSALLFIGTTIGKLSPILVCSPGSLTQLSSFEINLSLEPLLGLCSHFLDKVHDFSQEERVASHPDAPYVLLS